MNNGSSHSNDIANHANVTNFWRSLGAFCTVPDSSETSVISSHWPDRIWTRYGRSLSADGLTDIAAAARGRRLQMPVWGSLTPAEIDLLTRFGYTKTTVQFAMSLRLDSGGQTPRPQSPVTRVRQQADLAAWTSVASHAFNYTIDLTIVEPLLTRDGVELTVCWRSNSAGEKTIVGTGLIFCDDHAAGLHLLTVDSRYRRQGVARDILLDLLQRAQAAGHSLVTLQASDMGRPLYLKAGFVGDTLITNYVATL